MSAEIGARVVGIAERTAFVSQGDPPVGQTLTYREVSFNTVGTPGFVGVFMMPFFDPAVWPQFEVGVTYTITVAGPP